MGAPASRSARGPTRSRLAAAAAVAVAAVLSSPPRAAGDLTPIHYRFTFPEPEHRWMQIEASFADLDRSPLELRVSQSSPGRYALHGFAKNVYDVHVFARDGRELSVLRPDPDGWIVRDHGGAATVRYKVFGDRVDGTFLAIDVDHAHINMPAVIMWGRDLDDRPSVLTFEPPGRVPWTAATQLHAGRGPYEFTAPNLQYLMDSPVELGPVALRQFTSGQRTFRFAAHHTGTEDELDGFVKDVEKIVKQEEAVYGELPEYEPGQYTFLADYLPYAVRDGMEHRNSTVMTSSGSIRDRRLGLLQTVAHEFFHCWNVERIRPKSLEPFEFDRANMSGELWLAEGFTQYYGPLAMQRAGLLDIASTAQTLTGLVETVSPSSGRLVRSAVEMSEMAPFIDGAPPNDPTNWSNTVISYYPFGAAIALALDLSLRDRSNGRISLDDYMRAMWRVHGRPGGAREGYVDHPYTLADAEARLAEVSGDRSFAHDFFERYIGGHDVADYGRLLARAGFSVRRRRAGGAWWGDLRLEFSADGARVAALVPAAAPAYAAGLEQGDLVKLVDGEPLTAADRLETIMRRHKPGDRIAVAFEDRASVMKNRGSRPSRKTSLTLAEDPHVEVVPLESSGARLTAAQQAFRDAWLGPR
jgi:predicted metalloprotease with PDZ domain